MTSHLYSPAPWGFDWAEGENSSSACVLLGFNMFCSQVPMKSTALPTLEELCLSLGLTQTRLCGLSWPAKSRNHGELPPGLPMKQLYLGRERWGWVTSRCLREIDENRGKRAATGSEQQKGLPVHQSLQKERPLENTLSFCRKNKQAGRSKRKCSCFTARDGLASRGKCLRLHLLTYTHAQVTEKGGGSERRREKKRGVQPSIWNAHTLK